MSLERVLCEGIFLGEGLNESYCPRSRVCSFSVCVIFLNFKSVHREFRTVRRGYLSS